MGIPIRAFLVVTFLLPLCAVAGNPEHEINRRVEMFGSALGCNFHTPKQNMAAWKDKNGTGYLVLFSIDYGCSGGNAMDRPVLAIVRIGAYSTPYLDQQLSTPNRTSDNFPAIIERITKTGNNIQYIGRRLRPSDALCCASQLVQGTITLTAHGWEPKDERPIP